MSNRNKTGFRAGRDQATVTENLELLTGQRGNGLDRAITVRELAALGLIGVARNSSTGGVVTKPIPPTVPDIELPSQIPHAPLDFAAYGGFGSIMLEWRLPTFRGFAHAEIWRAAANSDGSEPTLEQATLIATTPATVFGDIVSPGSVFYYWCRFINIKDFPGPYNALKGTKAETSQDISDVINDIGDQMENSDLINDLNNDIDGVVAGVKENSDTISKIDENGSAAHQAMWSMKAQAGDIKAGIGILANSDGTSLVAVAASQFVAFDPNSPGKLTPTFAIDKGNVVIPKALIESATIQILNAQIITADKVVAGIEISSPKITGGSVTGGWAGFGPGGPYSGYHTHIASNGALRTNNIYASNGTFNGTVNANAGEFNNVVINENCIIKGDLVGDALDVLFLPKQKGQQIVDMTVGQKLTALTFEVTTKAPFPRRILIDTPIVVRNHGGSSDIVEAYEIHIIAPWGSVLVKRVPIGSNQVDMLGRGDEWRFNLSSLAYTVPTNASGRISIVFTLLDEYKRPHVWFGMGDYDPVYPTDAGKDVTILAVKSGDSLKP